jgi:hypothetical protein
MKQLRPFAWFIIIVNVGLLYSLGSTLKWDDDSDFRIGAVFSYLIVAGSINLILYILFRITTKRNK